MQLGLTVGVSRPLYVPAAGGAPATPPGGVTTNLALWLEGDQLALADGAAVATWTDKSANALHAVQSTSTKRPTYRATGGPNGKPCVDFLGDDGMVTPNLPLTGQAITVYVVANSTVDGTDQLLVECSADTNTNVTGFLLFRKSTNVTEAFIKGTGAISSSFTSTAALQSTPKLLATIYDRSLATNEVTIWTNGSNAGTRSLNNNNTDSFGSTQPLYIGSRANTSLFLTGKISLILIYTGAHVTGTRQAIEAAINTKYALGF